MKSELLTLLMEAAPNYISGQAICEKLNCSRTAVWKQIAQLKEEGYEIKAVRNKGYLLAHSSVPFSGHAVKAKLNCRILPYQIIFSSSLPSTQTKALRLATDGAEEGTVVIADQQTGGRGRLGRAWSTARGTGLAMSLLLKPDIPIHQAPQITLVAAVSIIKVLRKIGFDAKIKWPNDILIDNRKVCGILTEMQADPDRIQTIILGIGLNVNEQEFPEAIRNSAVSLSLINKEELSRTDIAAGLLNEFETDYQLFLQKSFSAFKSRWEEYSATLNRNVSVLHNNQMIYGQAVSISNEGVLKIVDESGKEHNIYSGDIEIH
ncbi:biotin--[acetyl-CoA-carboxylase] ligase [Alkalicoccus daliensis]|uniref:Bifunctional ligase/repressor BirA n=1 Tax=Alkalicoccus daliensis TaxID=745820 RepID=A0A1H0AU52_9BACI|nr:biotin--[acetyl-CoA-carboxylase] ligase [Alkalicoccus daliensis]SDN36593.1 BirA family transcriptional regulator, biotin operon repressor / biotin-[acetyl-CoA-carboxylase] ligase [Alkalicoccus daliensis]